MISSEVQRTLVKSPPELWSELSDPAALARHLDALGEIRITRTEPESLVEWEADGASGSVQIKPSGWGTKVTLSVNHELRILAEPDPADGDVTGEDPSATAEQTDAAAGDTDAAAEDTDAGARDPSETAEEPSLPMATSDGEEPSDAAEETS